MTELEIYLKPLTDKNAQLVTRYIKHLADSTNFKGVAFNNHCSGLTGNRFEMPNVSYTHPLPASKKMKISTIIITIFSLFVLSCNENKNSPIYDSKSESKAELKSETKADLEKDYSQSAENFAKEILKDKFRIHHFDLSNSKTPLFLKIFQTEGLENIVGYSNKNYPMFLQKTKKGLKSETYYTICQKKRT